MIGCQAIEFVEDDGGRQLAGRRGRAGDCVTRAIAIATGLDYADVYDALHERTLSSRPTMARLELEYGARARAHASPRTGVYPKIWRAYLEEFGWRWTPTMQVGAGCTTHLRAGEIPMRGPVVVKLSRHVAAVVDGVLRDTYDCSRGGTRCVYGYWTPA